MEDSNCRNPEISSNKKLKRELNKMTLNHKIEQILNENIDFAEMLDSLSQTLK